MRTFDPAPPGEAVVLQHGTSGEQKAATLKRNARTSCLQYQNLPRARGRVSGHGVVKEFLSSRAPAALERAGDERAQVEEGRDGEEDRHERGVVDLPRKPHLRTARVTRKAAFVRTIWWLSLM